MFAEVRVTGCPKGQPILSRIPAPLNITEIGGYFNLMMRFKKEAKQEQEETLKRVFSDMLNQTLSSILGLPMQPSTQAPTESTK